MTLLLAAVRSRRVLSALPAVGLACAGSTRVGCIRTATSTAHDFSLGIGYEHERKRHASIKVGGVG